MRMKRGWPEIWRRPGALAWILRPLSWAYGCAWWLLNLWHRRRPPELVPGLKVLSVGNLSVGGTGKTALVKVLAQASLRQRRRTAVLLRGYGAQAGVRPLWVSRGRGALVDAGHSGDEAQEHARLPGLGVVIDSDRLRGAREAQALGYQVLILDDGFQRRWQLQRQADLLLAGWGEISLGARLLPAGPWREPWSQALQARALLLQEAPKKPSLPEPWARLPLLKVGYQAERLWAWKAGVLKAGPPLSRLKGLKVLAFSGLGQPERFEASLRGLGAEVVPQRFADHHRYGAAELAAFDTQGVKAFCTTLKDAMRLPGDWKPGRPVWVLEASLKSQPEAALKRLVDSCLN
jgi:tetraacyldisaccharide 4'-kinase